MVELEFNNCNLSFSLCAVHETIQEAPGRCHPIQLFFCAQDRNIEEISDCATYIPPL
jgi:hypothetical protein